MLVEKSMHPDWLSNAFVVAAEGGPAVFVDSGADVAPLIEAVERWGVTPVALLRTHSHHDHVVNEEGVVATGDTLFRDAVGGGDVAVVKQSVMDVLLALPDATRVLPGHADETTIGRERRENPFIRVWSGAEPEGSERVKVGGRDATLLVWSPDYDGNGKAWVRYDDGEEATVGGSRVERNA